MARPALELNWKPPVVALTQEEVDELNDLAAANEIPRDWWARYQEASAKQVFGHDVKYDRHGEPIEQGVGSAAQPTRNSIDAYKSTQLSQKGGVEAGYEEHLQKMESDLAAYDATQVTKRASERAARRNARA